MITTPSYNLAPFLITCNTLEQHATARHNIKAANIHIHETQLNSIINLQISRKLQSGCHVARTHIIATKAHGWRTYDIARKNNIQCLRWFMLIPLAHE